MNDDQDTERRECTCVVVGYISYCSHGTTDQKFLKRVELDLAFDLVALTLDLLDMCP